MRIERLGLAHPDAARLVAEVQEEYASLYGSPDETPLESAYFDPPAGAFFVGYLDDVPVATGAWRRRADVAVPADGGDLSATAEIKRMYVVRSWRRRGLAREMLAHLEQTAAGGGALAMVLETGVMQPAALAMYADAGYTRIEPFGHYAWSPSVRCLAKVLTASPARFGE